MRWTCKIYINHTGYHEYISRNDERDIRAIADRVEKTGRFNGLKAKVVEVFQYREAKKHS